MSKQHSLSRLSLALVGSLVAACSSSPTDAPATPAAPKVQQTQSALTAAEWSNDWVVVPADTTVQVTCDGETIKDTSPQEAGSLTSTSLQPDGTLLVNTDGCAIVHTVNQNSATFSGVKTCEQEFRNDQNEVEIILIQKVTSSVVTMAADLSRMTQVVKSDLTLGAKECQLEATFVYEEAPAPPQ